MSVVFTDSFTAGADTDIESWPAASPNNDYDYILFAGANNLRVTAATDRCEANSGGNDQIARISDASVSSGVDYQISLDAFRTGGYSGGYPAVRCGAADSGNCYLVLCASSTVQELYRCNGGTFTLLSSGSITAADSTLHAWTLRASGTGATVTLTWTLDGSADQTFGDSSGSRLTTGVVGIGGYMDGTAYSVYVDNVSVDNMSAGATSFPFHPASRRALAGLLAH